jgi:hypothetical protein
LDPDSHTRLTIIGSMNKNINPRRRCSMFMHMSTCDFMYRILRSK